MNKIIIDQPIMKVSKEQEETFLKEMHGMKAFLQSNNIMPMEFNVFKDIGKEGVYPKMEREENIYVIQIVFESDEAYDEWQVKLNNIPNYDRSGNPIIKYFKSYLYLEKII